MIKKLQTVKLLMLLITLAASSSPLIGYSKYRNVTSTITTQNTSGESVKFTSSQVYCHTSGPRQKAMAVFLYGKSESLPSYSTKFTASCIENDFLEKTFSTEKLVKYDDVVFTSQFLLKIAQKINVDVMAAFGFNKSTSFVINLAGKEYFVEVKKDRDVFSSSFDEVLVTTVYGQAEKIPAVLLSMLKTLVLQKNLEISQDGFPLKTSDETHEFIKRCVCNLSNPNLPEYITFWVTIPPQRSEWQSPYAQHPAVKYPMEHKIICENALTQKASNSFTNVCAPENDNNLDGKQARFLFVWESDLVGTGFIIKNAALLKRNHWIVVILNDLQREYNNAETNKIWDEFLTSDNQLIIPNVIQLLTPVRQQATQDIIATTESFLRIEGNSSIVFTYTRREDTFANEAISNHIGVRATGFLKNQAFIYN